MFSLLQVVFLLTIVTQAWNKEKLMNIFHQFTCENAQSNFGFELKLKPHFSITVELELKPHFSITVELELKPHFSIAQTLFFYYC